jgi:hypothetical protein
MCSRKNACALLLGGQRQAAYPVKLGVIGSIRCWNFGCSQSGIEGRLDRLGK